MERNQKTMMAIISALETKRKRELAEAAKRKKAAAENATLRRKKCRIQFRSLFSRRCSIPPIMAS